MDDSFLPVPQPSEPESGRPIQPYGQYVQGPQQPQPFQYGQQRYGQQLAPTQQFAQTTVAHPKVSGGHIAVAWVIAVITFGYMLPWAIAATRQKRNALAIALVNFLAGWTLLGWIAALVMACMSEPVHVTNIAYARGAGIAACSQLERSARGLVSGRQWRSTVLGRTALDRAHGPAS